MVDGVTERSEPTGKPTDRDIPIGGGFPVRVVSLKEIVSVQHDKDLIYDDKEVELPEDVLPQIRDQLANLPFWIGSKGGGHYFGTPNEAELCFSQRTASMGDPENVQEQVKQQQLLAIRFGKDSDVVGLGLGAANNVHVRQVVGKEKTPVTVVNFTPEKPINMAGREVGEVSVVMPAHHAPPQK